MSKRSTGKGRDSTLIPFHSLFSGSLVSGGVSISASPVGLSGRAGVEADAWCHFRINSLRFRLLPTSPITGLQVAGFIGGVQDTAPATTADMAEVLSSTIKGVGQTVYSEWVKVTRQELAGPFPWYKSIAGAADPTEESPGTLILRGTGTDTYTLEVRGVFEFKTSVSTANTPAALQLRKRVREERLANLVLAERDILMKILGGGVTATPGKVP
jgi:hypothetical protein